VISANARFAILAIAIAGTALVLHTRTREDLLPPGSSLASLPLQFGGWAGADLPFSPQTLAVLGPGEFLQRQYREPSEEGAYVDVYVAHRPNQQALGRHVPTDCLLGSGWSLADSGTTTVSLPGGAGFTANRYLVTKGAERQLVLFWFWAHGHGVASLNRADFYLALDSLRFNREDNMLVRVNTPVRPGETADDAQRRLFSFATRLKPLLDNFAR
jgi:EpsI family protein